MNITLRWIDCNCCPSKLSFLRYKKQYFGSVSYDVKQSLYVASIIKEGNYKIIGYCNNEKGAKQIVEEKVNSI